MTDSNLPKPVTTGEGLWGGATFHTISFNSSGGSSVTQRKVAAGNAIGKLPVPLKQSYNFAGWWTAATGGTQINAATEVKADMSLIARWNPITTTRPQEPLPTSIAITDQQTGLPLLEGKTRSLSGKVSPANAVNKTVNWKSSNPKVASVDSKGLVKAVSPGTAQITATAAAANISASATVKVEASPQSINSSLRDIKMKQGTSLRIPVLVRGSSNVRVPIDWKSSNSSVATLEKGKASGTLSIKQNTAQDLVFQAIKPGSAKIVLTSHNGKSITYKVTVQAQSTKLSKVSIGNLPAKNTLHVKNSRTLTAKLSPVNASSSGKVQWTSSKPKIVSVDQAGKITALKKGRATITLKVGSKTDKVTLAVK